MTGTARVYLDDDRCFETEAAVVAVRGAEMAFDRTCFFPGGGGQPCDTGTAQFESGEELRIDSVFADADGVVWHVAKTPAPPGIEGRRARLRIDSERRMILSRHHTALHVLNTIALREHGGWITGAQIGEEHSRIDFNLPGYSGEMRAEMESKVNAVLDRRLAVTSYFIDEEEFRAREDLLRTLEARPPVNGGRIRVVEIQGFEAQACGGTHARNTSEVGRFAIIHSENKGKKNKRLYIRLDTPLAKI